MVAAGVAELLESDDDLLLVSDDEALLLPDAPLPSPEDLGLALP
jgi:hypothetical protein